MIFMIRFFRSADDNWGVDVYQQYTICFRSNNGELVLLLFQNLKETLMVGLVKIAEIMIGKLTYSESV